MNNRKIQKEEIVEEKVIFKERRTKEEKKRYLLLLLLLLFVFMIGSSYAVIKSKNKLEDIWITITGQDKPSAPVISGGNENWSRKEIVRVIKDAKSSSGISHYEYCVTEKTVKNCEWKRTDTKNTVISTTGKYQVYFRGVSKKGTKGKSSNEERVQIDNASPRIDKVEPVKIRDHSIELRMEAKDEHSGILSYEYRIQNGKYEKVNWNFQIKKLEKNTEYEIEVRVIDKVGNSATSKIMVKTLSEGEGTSPGEGVEPAPTPTSSPVPTPGEEELEAPIYSVTPDNDKWSSYKIVTIHYPVGVEKEYSLDSGKTWESYTGPILFTENGSIIGRSKLGNKIKAAEELNIIFIDPESPKIHLDLVPVEFEYGKNFKLPSYVTFGESGGSSVCKVSGTEYTDTTKLGIGNHVIECTAYGNNGLTASVSKEIEVVGREEGEWDGWITLTLFYPENSTLREWRIGDPNSIRDENENTGWKEYTGPITVKLSDVENIYIRYMLNGEEVVIPPSGRLLVDIRPDRFWNKNGENTNVEIVFDSKAETKEYKINNGSWTTYTGSFEVGSNTRIEARATMNEKVYDPDGNLVLSRKLMGNDAIYVRESADGSYGSGNGESSESGGVGPGVGGGTGSYEPSYYLEGPTITTSPKTLAESVDITITTKDKARTIYYSTGGNYQIYTGSFQITKNGYIRAYYVRESDGMKSGVTYYYVNNIKHHNKPYVRIDANPFPYIDAKKANKVDVSISGSDYDTLEYSLDGVNYQNYALPISFTKNGSIYARGTNQYGITIEKLSITTIIDPETGATTPSERPIALSVSIFADPDYSEVDRVARETEVTIVYDKRSTNNTYRIGTGPVKPYTGPFTVDRNSTVYAYASMSGGSGSAVKGIDYLTSGIMKPVIIPSAENSKPASSVKLTIQYDRNALIKRYRVGDGPLLTYKGSITVDENSVIYAVNENELGDVAESTYEVSNIAPRRPPIVIDFGKYYLLKLNYPEKAKEKEYKWTATGSWKSYLSQGILLIKEEYKDDFVGNDGLKVQIEDENGKVVNFTGDYYIVHVPFYQVMENIYMRWDNQKLEAPKILLNTDRPTNKVEVSILYSSNLVGKEYKFISESGVDSGWKKYTVPFTLKENGAIYAKGMTSNEVNSEISSLQVKNIDNINPEIILMGNFVTIKNKVNTLIRAKDLKGIEVVKWDRGTKETSYFSENGNLVKNNSTITITENGMYTFYAKDKAGNETVLIKEITNIDKTKPLIEIDILTKEKGTEAEIEINFGNSTSKKYRFGRNNTTWVNYTGTIKIDSNMILDKGWGNADGTVTIYAKGVNALGNEETVSEEIYVIYLNRPKTPVFNAAGGGYPILTEYGVKIDDAVAIDFDSDSNVENRYSIDGGKTWKEYFGKLENTAGTIMARSIAKDSGLKSEVTYKIAVPTDALKPEAYDGNDTTYDRIDSGKRKIYIDSALWKSTINLESRKLTSLSANLIVSFVDEKNTVIDEITFNSKYWPVSVKLVIPENAVFIEFQGTGNGAAVKEIQVVNDPIINDIRYYPALTEYGVIDSYNDITIDYFFTTVERLYRIGDNEEWKEYQDSPIRLEIGETIYVKGIDKYGEDSNTSYTAQVSQDALLKEAYDGNDTTYDRIDSGKRKIYIDSALWKSTINLGSRKLTSLSASLIVSFVDEKNTVIEEITFNSKYWPASVKLVIPENAVFIEFQGTGNGVAVKEIQVVNDPVINDIRYYPVLREDGIKDSYNEVTIDYFATTVERLYRIGGTGEWKEYQDSPIRLEIGETIYAKGIDKYGEDSNTSSYTGQVLQYALPKEGYDGDLSSTVKANGGKNGEYYLLVDESMFNHSIKVVWSGYKISDSKMSYVYFEDYQGNILFTGSVKGGSKQTMQYLVPEGTAQIRIVLYYSDAYSINFSSLLYEVSPVIAKNDLSNSNYEPPRINVGEKRWSTEKIVTINYGQTVYENEYSIDLGKTWIKYIAPFKVEENTTVFTRIRNGQTLLSSSSYKIKRIDSTEPTISLNNLPDEIEMGEDYLLPTEYFVDENKSSGQATCMIEGVEYKTTKDLKSGTYLVECSVETGVGKSSKTSKTLLVRQIILPEETPVPIPSPTPSESPLPPVVEAPIPSPVAPEEKPKEEESEGE